MVAQLNGSPKLGTANRIADATTSKVEARTRRLATSTRTQAATRKTDVRARKARACSGTATGTGTSSDMGTTAVATPKAGSTAAPSRRRKRKMRPGNFIDKLHLMMNHVDRNGLDSIISWIHCGRAFVIKDPDCLVDVISLFFDQTKYRSFRRQLCMWHFKRVLRGAYKGAFYHPYFLKDHPDLSRNVPRKAFEAVATDENVRRFEEQLQALPWARTSSDDSPVAASNLARKERLSTASHVHTAPPASPSRFEDGSARPSEVGMSAGKALPRVLDLSALDLQPMPLKSLGGRESFTSASLSVQTEMLIDKLAEDIDDEVSKCHSKSNDDGCDDDYSSNSNSNSNSDSKTPSAFSASYRGARLRSDCQDGSNAYAQQLAAFPESLFAAKLPSFDDAVANLQMDMFELPLDNMLPGEEEDADSDPVLVQPLNASAFENGDLLMFEGRQFYYVESS